MTTIGSGYIIEDIHEEENMVELNRVLQPSCERDICAKEEEEDNLEKNRETFENPIPWRNNGIHEMLDEMLENMSAREEEEDNLEKDWQTFGCAIPWEYEPFDAIL